MRRVWAAALIAVVSFTLAVLTTVNVPAEPALQAPVQAPTAEEFMADQIRGFAITLSRFQVQLSQTINDSNARQQALQATIETQRKEIEGLRKELAEARSPKPAEGTSP